MHNRHLLSNALGRSRFADQLIDYLINMGVEYLFGMPAESVNSLVHAASQRAEIQVVTTRHETAAAIMATGYARSSGRLGVCFGTAGPGATNLAAGAYEAFIGRVPLLAISGQVHVASIGTGSFQEIDSESLFKSCTSSSIQINDVSQFERFARSCVLAMHESTACHVAIPGDVLYSPIAQYAKRLSFPEVPVPLVASKDALDAVVNFVESEDLTVVLSCADSESAALAGELCAQLGCALDAGDRSRRSGDTAMISSRDVLVVGRWSPALQERIRGFPRVIELTDRPLTAKRVPNGQQVVCDVAATLETALEILRAEQGPRLSALSAGSDRRAPVPAAYRVFADVAHDGGMIADDLLPPGAEIFSSQARVVGAALPFAIASALARGHDGVDIVVTDHRHLGQFVADLSTLVDVGGRVVVLYLVESREKLLFVRHLGEAMALPVWVAETEESLKDLLERAILEKGPVILAASRKGVPVCGDQREPRPGERALARHLAANVAAPIQISHWAAGGSVFSAVAQTSLNAQAPSMKAAALRKSGSVSAATVATSESELLLQLNGIYDAAFDDAGIVVVTVEKQPWVMDSRKLLESVATLQLTVDDPANAADVVRHACAAERGVVHLQVLACALESDWDNDSLSSAAPHTALKTVATNTLDETVLNAAVAMLLDAERVAIVAGRGTAGCSDLLVELSAILSCRVHVTMGGDSVLDDAGLRLHGRIGGSGDMHAYRDVARADVLLVIGVSNRGLAFDLANDGRSVVINRDPQAMLRLGPHDVGVLADAKVALERIIGALQTRASWTPRSPRRSEARSRTTIPARGISGLLLRRKDRAPLRASHLTQAIHAALLRFDGSSTVCADVGVNTLWVYRYVTSMTRSIWSASFGTMGFAVPAAITVARNDPGTGLAVAVAGDGGTAVTLGEIESSIGIETPVVFVVINNGALAAIKFESEIMGWPDRASMLPDINFAEYAASVGIPSRRVGTLRDFRSAFDEAVRSAGPYLIDARCILNDAPVQAGPKNWRQVAGFLLAWCREGRAAVGFSREVVRSVVHAKLSESSFG